LNRNFAQNRHNLKTLRLVQDQDTVKKSARPNFTLSVTKTLSKNIWTKYWVQVLFNFTSVRVRQV